MLHNLVKRNYLLSLMASLVRNKDKLNASIGGLTGAIEISITFPTEYTKTVM